ncbi:hypothetical protein KKA69_01245 [Patescibacteria group bacterium]|nr:hypothetical protein [Patescibacteria group bacterium]
MTKQFIATICILGLVGMVVGVVAKADTADVAATVTPELISVTVDVTSVAYGIVPLSTVDDAPDPDSVIIPTNDGNVTVKLDIRGANSTTWTLSSTAVGANTFMHKFGLWDGANLGALTALDSVAYAVLTASVAPGVAGDDFKLRLSTPDSTTAYAEEGTTVTVLATKL